MIAALLLIVVLDPQVCMQDDQVLNLVVQTSDFCLRLKLARFVGVVSWSMPALKEKQRGCRTSFTIVDIDDRPQSNSCSCLPVQ